MIVRSFAIRTVTLILALAQGLSAYSQTSQGKLLQQPGFVSSEFVADLPPTAFSHASTIVEAGDDLIAAWMGGYKDRDRDVSIWAARKSGDAWGEPVMLANGIHDNVRIQYPCWNPVLFKQTAGPLILFYKEGPSPETWWGMVKVSEDNGVTWSEARRLPRGMIGPVRSKPIELSNGQLLCPSSTENEGWAIHMERTKNPFRGEWFKGPRINNTLDFGAIQPTLLQHPDGRIQALCRSKNGVILETWSQDFGADWSRMKKTALPNPNGAIDAIPLRDNLGFILVYNHSEVARDLLNVATSKDGRRWEAALVLEDEPGMDFSYPTVIQTGDRLIHITYTWKKQKIRHVVLDPAKFSLRPIVNGEWPR